MREWMMILLVMLTTFPALARAPISTSVVRAWLACNSVADAQAYARAKTGGVKETIEREEGRLTAPRTDGHPACQRLIPGAKVEIAKSKADMRCVDEFHTYGSGCLWLPATVLHDPSAERRGYSPTPH